MIFLILIGKFGRNYFEKGIIQKKYYKYYYGEWLIVENDKKYTNNLQIQLLAQKIKDKFNP